MKKLLSSCLAVALAALLVAACAPAPITTTPPPTRAPAAATPSTSPTTSPQKPAATPQPQQPPKVTPATSSEKPYFEGKTINVMVTASAGGGTDAIARIDAALLPKYIPGSPRIVVQNKPGGGGTIAANWVFNQAKPDGLTLLRGSSSQIAAQMRNLDTVKYDLNKMGFIGYVNLSGALMLVSKKTLPGLTDPKARPLAMGSRAGEETANAMPLWGQEFLGWNIKWVIGFGGGGEIDLAFRRGELDIQSTYNAFVIRPLLQEGLAVPVSQIGVYREGKFTRRPDFPDVPTFIESLGDKKPTGAPWQSYIAWIGPSMVDKWLAVPPGTPENVTRILIDAYTRMTQDPKFDEMVKKTVGEPYGVGIGKDAENLIREVVSTPAEALEYGTHLQRKFGILSK